MCKTEYNIGSKRGSKETIHETFALVQTRNDGGLDLDVMVEVLRRTWSYDIL